MLSFKSFLKESRDLITNVSRQEISKFDKAIAPYTYTVKGSSTKTTEVIVRSAANDRKTVKTDIEKKLTKSKITFTPLRTGGSTGSTQVEFKNHQVKILYKPVSGGMSETTLNSTITELVPCIAFMAKKKINDPEKLYQFVTSIDSKKYGVYVNDGDAKAGKDFIDTMPTSSKFIEKMENAIAIANYLYDLHKDKPIKQLYWGYRAKPAGIDSSHKGDIFAKFNDGEMLGVSLKAGGEKTAEPQLNTYVNKFFDDIGYEGDKNKLIDTVYKQIHSKLDLPKDWDSRTNKRKSIDTISEFKQSNPVEYENYYDKMLELCRTAVINAVNKDMNKTLDYIKKNVIKKSEDVPLVVIKAFGKKYKQVTDEDELGIFMPKIKTVVAKKSSTSKQNWEIHLKSNDTILIMNMSIRSNKSEPENKIAQGFNLAIKFNGIKVK
jgi:hypothetical protein